MTILECVIALHVFTGVEIPLIQETAAEIHQVAPALTKDLLVIATIESNFNPVARSPRGAVGTMQLTPPAVEEVQRNLCPGVTAKPDTPAGNIQYGACFYRQLYQRLGQLRAVLWYNGGGRAVLQASRLRLNTETAKYWMKFTWLRQEVCTGG
jgi:soluble lytic murein transglycosylase-like protein